MSRLAEIAIALPTEGVSEEIVCIPEGVTQITPFADGKVRETELRVDAGNRACAATALAGGDSVAAVLEPASVDRLRAKGRGERGESEVLPPRAGTKWDSGQSC